MKIFGIYKKLLSLVLFVLLLAPTNFAYLPGADDDKSEEEKIAELKANAKELLRETAAMAQTLVSPTNRISFTIKSADILWGLDETDARAMFNASTEDIKRLIAQVDVETNQQKNMPKTTWGNRSSSSSLRSKTSQVFSLRTSLVNALANHDPEWAMRFVQETGQMFTVPALARRLERENKRLESNIIKKIAAKDVTKALELGREKLAKGVSSEVTSLLNQIYAKDKEKGASFAKDVLQKLKSSSLRDNSTWIIIRLFQTGLKSADAENNPLFDKSAMGDLAELVANQVTNSSSRYRNLSAQMMKGLEKYSPNSASQVKRTFEQRNSTRNPRTENRRGQSKNFSNQKRWGERTKFQKELSESLKGLDDESLSSEDKQKLIKEAKSKVLSVEDEKFRFNGLVSLAKRAALAGEKETAGKILDEAESFINQDPTEKTDFTNNRNLANAYALVDIDRSFIIWENMVYRLNGVINGYIKYMEFSGNRRIVENSEMIIGSRSRQFTTYLRFSRQALKSLAENDYNRLKDLADKFERAEIRIETRLLIAKGMLSSVNQKDSNTPNGKKVKIERISRG